MYRWIIAFGVAAIATGGAGLAGWMLRGTPDEWRPTGDGKTIVNSHTGQLKYAATGLTIEETRARHEKIDAADRQSLAARERQVEANYAALRKFAASYAAIPKSRNAQETWQWGEMRKKLAAGNRLEGHELSLLLGMLDWASSVGSKDESVFAMRDLLRYGDWK